MFETFLHRVIRGGRHAFETTAARESCALPFQLLILALGVALATPAAADRLRISPEDLRLRVAVSDELPTSVRRELKDLARSAPLPVEDGLVQSERLLQERFGEREFSAEKAILVRYYFLVARLDHSQTFSDEFLRRESLIRNGLALLKEYIDHLNQMIARALYTDAPEVEIPRVQSFPLVEVEKTEEGELLILHRFAALDIGLGRINLRKLRQAANAEVEALEGRLDQLRRAEREFLEEVSLLGYELIRMRPAVRELVTVPGEGLPFSF